MRLSEINIYPLKSAGTVSLRESELDALGLVLDRRYMLIGADGRFLSQRCSPLMAQLDCTDRGEFWLFQFPGAESLQLPKKADWSKEVPCELWGESCTGLGAPDRVNTWFRSVLGQADLRCVYMPNRLGRQVSLSYGQQGDQVGFADGFPLLLTNQGSLDDLNGRLTPPIPMNRFRPNLVIEGAEAFAEDTWRVIRIGDVLLKMAKPCARCKVITVDQDTSESSKEPLQTLATYRKQNGEVMFGQNTIHANNGILKVGMPVVVVEWA